MVAQPHMWHLKTCGALGGASGLSFFTFSMNSLGVTIVMNLSCFRIAKCQKKMRFAHAWRQLSSRQYVKVISICGVGGCALDFVRHLDNHRWQRKWNQRNSIARFAYAANLSLLAHYQHAFEFFCSLIQQVANIQCMSKAQLATGSYNWQHACSFNLMSLLVAEKCFFSASLRFLAKGHTHRIKFMNTF